VYVGKGPETGKPRQVSRVFRGGKQRRRSIVDVQCGPIRSTRRFSEHQYAVAIVGKDAGDVKLLSTGNQLEVPTNAF
jgi:hypothetical protein